MDRDAFLLKLRQALTGKLPSDLVEEHAQYYRDYINTQVRMGEDEEEVLRMLGDPRLIARSIVDASGVKAQDSGYREASDYTQPESSGKERKVRMGGVSGRAVLIVAVVVICLVLSLALRLFFYVLPFLFPVLFVAMLVKFVRDWIR